MLILTPLNWMDVRRHYDGITPCSNARRRSSRWAAAGGVMAGGAPEGQEFGCAGDDGRGHGPGVFLSRSYCLHTNAP
jgi:hypothetical protein